MEVNSNSVEFVHSVRSKLVQRKKETRSRSCGKQVRCDFCKKKFAAVDKLSWAKNAKEMACVDDIYCVMHGLIFLMLIVLCFEHYVPGFCQAQKGDLKH